LPNLTQIVSQAALGAARFPWLLPLPLLLVGTLYFLRARTPARVLAALLGVATALCLLATMWAILLPLLEGCRDP
jgi:hypothetical protein